MFDNIASLLPHHARRKPHHPALIQGEHTITYRQLDLDVRRTAAHILDLDISPGDIVAMAMLDGADYAVVMMALARAGAVMLPLDVRWTVDEKQRVAAFFGAGTVLVSEGAENIPNLRTLPVDDAWHAHVARADAERDFPGDPDAPMLLSLSSGTTGTPKGPMLSHQQMLLRARTQWVTLTMNEHDRFLCATPMYFGGARGYTLCHLVIGGTVVMMPPPWGPEQIVAAVHEKHITSLFLVPTLLRRMLELAGGDGYLLAPLRLLVSSGANLFSEEREAIMRRVAPNFVNAYSSTEGGFVSLLTPAHTGEHATSVGQAAFLTEFEIVDDDHQPVPLGEIGRIRHRSPWVPAGYHNNPEESAHYFRDGFYYTGDLGRTDAEGFLYLTGRAKDMIIRGGVNIYPVEIEEILLRHPAVHDAAVVGWPSEEYNEEVAAFVVLQDDVETADLIEHCRASLARYKVPREIFVIDKLPKNSVGKVLKTELVGRLPEIARADRV